MLMLLGMSMSMSVADANVSSAPDCPFPGFLGHGISSSSPSIQDSTVLVSDHRREYEPQRARPLRSTDNVYYRIFVI
jgi:hypothetical protein